MEDRQILGAIEALLFVWGDPLSYKEIAKALEITPKRAKDFANDLKEQYEYNRYGLKIVRIGECYQIQTRPEHYQTITKVVDKSKDKKLSNSAMETLSIIAYKQPITRMEVENIRGVKCNSPIDTLMAKGLIKEVGRLDKIGKPILFGTTDEFLRVFSLESLETLPGFNNMENYISLMELDDEAE